jgi:dGTP triphosphohydrolase
VYNQIYKYIEKHSKLAAGVKSRKVMNKKLIYICANTKKGRDTVEYSYHTQDEEVKVKNVTMSDKVTFDYSVVSQAIKNLTGRILTIVDASYTDPVQRKAVKDLVRKEMIEEFEFYSSLCFPNLEVPEFDEKDNIGPVSYEEILEN